MTILKRKDFARWQAGERLPDAALCRAVHEMETGLIDADVFLEFIQGTTLKNPSEELVIIKDS